MDVASSTDLAWLVVACAVGVVLIILAFRRPDAIAELLGRVVAFFFRADPGLADVPAATRREQVDNGGPALARAEVNKRILRVEERQGAQGQQIADLTHEVRSGFGELREALAAGLGGNGDDD